jgi:hypothetical protein
LKLVDAKVGHDATIDVRETPTAETGANSPIQLNCHSIAPKMSDGKSDLGRRQSPTIAKKQRKKLAKGISVYRGLP